MKKFYSFLILFLISAKLLAIDLQDIYDNLPNPQQCVSGSVKNSEKLKILQYVNFIRSLHGLDPLQYDPAGDVKSQDAALMCVANNNLDHQPPSSWFCYTQDGFDGANKSSLYINWNNGAVIDSKQSIMNWMIDNNVPQLGHRFSIIQPHLTKFSFGRCEGKPKVNSQFSNTIVMVYKYLDNLESELTIPVTVDFVGYPQGEYPKELVKKDWYLSFTAVTDKYRWFNSKADYSTVQIEVLDSKNQKMMITDTSSRWASSAGVMNIFQWKMPDMKDYEEYTVNIKNVKIGVQTRDYNYKFKLVDYSGSDLMAPILDFPANNSINVSTLPLFFPGL
jgi:uncharacterized protein YkwD